MFRCDVQLSNCPGPISYCQT
uniref:Uncharacterized protein n=1 Tax=Anguilla anguilla TaxID=7936 RepID=A0A0E9US09_ANGAN